MPQYRERSSELEEFAESIKLQVLATEVAGKRAHELSIRQQTIILLIGATFLVISASRSNIETRYPTIISAFGILWMLPAWMLWVFDLIRRPMYPGFFHHTSQPESTYVAMAQELQYRTFMLLRVEKVFRLIALTCAVPVVAAMLLSFFTFYRWL
jgi:hypothetical protein